MKADSKIKLINNERAQKFLSIITIQEGGGIENNFKKSYNQKIITNDSFNSCNFNY